MSNLLGRKGVELCEGDNITHSLLASSNSPLSFFTRELSGNFLRRDKRCSWSYNDINPFKLHPLTCTLVLSPISSAAITICSLTSHTTHSKCCTISTIVITWWSNLHLLTGPRDERSIYCQWILLYNSPDLLPPSAVSGNPWLLSS